MKNNLVWQVQGSQLNSALSRRGLDATAILAAAKLYPDDIVYVGGSLVEGLGDNSSDLDVFVLTSRENIAARRGEFDSERRELQERLEFGISYLTIGDVELDVEFHAVEKFHALFNALNQMRPVNRVKLWESFRSLGGLERTHALELLHRFRCSWTLGNFDSYQRLRACFDEETFLRWNAMFCLMECEDYAKGTNRSLREGDAQSACLKLRYFFDNLVDATLFDAGQSLDRWKWRLPKLRLLAADELHDDYIAVQFSHGTDLHLTDLAKHMLVKGQVYHKELLRRYE